MPSGPSTPATTTQIQKTELPKWVDRAAQANLAEANKVAAQPYMAYEGPRVAQMTNAERSAPGMVLEGQRRANGAYDVATGAVAGATGYQPSMVSAPAGPANVTAGSFLGQDISRYMDPNVEAVINPTLARMEEESTRAGQVLSDNARSVGAFGGSRQGVEKAVLAARGIEDRARVGAGLRSQAFESAAGRAGQDINTSMQAALANQGAGITTQAQRMQAEQANQSAGLAGAGLRVNAGQALAGVGQTAATTANQGALLSSQFGAQERAVNQAGMDADYQAFMERRDAPKEAINLRMAALGMTPYGKTTSGQSTSTTPSSTNPWMTGIGAVASLAPLLFSDRKVKKNVKRVGKVPGSNLNKYEFEYKTGFMGGGTGKQVGLMADDVKRKVPNAVTPVFVNGQKVEAVDYRKAISESNGKGRKDKGKMRRPYVPRISSGFMGRSFAA